jgi:chemotaxis protein methyltransferase CheR
MQAQAAGVEISLSQSELRAIQKFIFHAAGITLSDAKRALIGGRLGKRLRAYGLRNYHEYLQLIERDAQERQTALDLLTTNETYFFREAQHFEFLRREILPQRAPGRPFRVWSAACSSGEEPYSIAMLLDEQLGAAPWELMATDISTQVLEKCRRGRYLLERAQQIPPAYLKAYCLKGTGPEEGFLLVDKVLRRKVTFMQANLNAALPALGEFDLIFLRNVMIYFDMATKRSLIARLAKHLCAGGWLFIGHSESLHGINEALRQIQPAIYRKP